MLDLNGNHAVQCGNTTAARLYGHNAIRDAFKFLGERAGLNGVCEPNTSKMLMGEIDTAHIKHYFPKAVSKKTTETFWAALANETTLHLCLTDRLKTLRAACSADVLRKAQKNPIKRVHPGEQNDAGDDENAGRRLDISLTSNHTNEVVGDVSQIHPTTLARLTPSFRYYATLNSARKDSILKGVASTHKQASTPAIVTAAAQKLAKYNPLIAICKDQQRRKIRASVPQLLCLIFDHAGQMSTDVYSCIEFMAMHKGRHLTRGEIEEGTTSKIATARFRAFAKDHLATVNAAQWASQLNASYMFPRDSWLAGPQLSSDLYPCTSPLGHSVDDHDSRT
jgi:hypothetical protein